MTRPLYKQRSSQRPEFNWQAAPDLALNRAGLIGGSNS